MFEVKQNFPSKYNNVDGVLVKILFLFHFKFYLLPLFSLKQSRYVYKTPIHLSNPTKLGTS